MTSPGVSGGLPTHPDLGTFTKSLDWLNAPPQRSELTFNQACDLLRLAIEGEPIPFDLSVQQLLSDVALIGNNEINRWKRAAEHEHAAGLHARRGNAAAWRLLWDAGKRLTLRTSDLREALDASVAVVDPAATPKPPPRRTEL